MSLRKRFEEYSIGIKKDRCELLAILYYLILEILRWILTWIVYATPNIKYERETLLLGLLFKFV